MIGEANIFISRANLEAIRRRDAAVEFARWLRSE
jgi:hypothetical protein